MLKITATLVLSAMAQVALANDAPAGTMPPDAAAASEKSTKAEASSTKDLGFELPPGFKAVKRGEIVVYCYKDATVGIRFKTRKCYNEEQLRVYLLAFESQQRFPLMDAR
jgi:hypothetical protein